MQTARPIATCTEHQKPTKVSFLIGAIQGGQSGAEIYQSLRLRFEFGIVGPSIDLHDLRSCLFRIHY